VDTANLDETMLRRDGRAVERVFDTLLEEILSGAVAPASKLNGPDLALRFGCSRGPVREALRRLEERQLVRCTPNAGAHVVSHTPQQVIEAYEAREALEGMAARLAARHMTADERAAMRAAFEAEKARGDTREYHKDFHVHIVHGSHNSRLVQGLSEDLFRVFRMWRANFPWLQWGGEDTWVDHRRILEAIELGDEDSAEMLMRRHIRRLRLDSIAGLRHMGLEHTIDAGRRGER
jgi:DNA-binding GntR family transcriptional regulator